MFTAALATWVSLRLIPPSPAQVRLAGARPPRRRASSWQSVVAGWDVARRALDPRLPLAPGFVDYPCAFAPGLLRNAFASLTSLMPGTVPLADDGEDAPLSLPRRDISPVVESLGKEEALVARVLDPGAAR